MRTVFRLDRSGGNYFCGIRKIHGTDHSGAGIANEQPNARSLRLRRKGDRMGDAMRLRCFVLWLREFLTDGLTVVLQWHSAVVQHAGSKLDIISSHTAFKRAQL